jgi:hypothetical protein
MHKVSTLFLKGAVAIIGLIVISVALYLIYGITKEMIDVMPIQYELLPILITVLLSLVPFIVGLLQALKLINMIEKNQAFSNASVIALKWIKKSASAIAILFSLCLLALYVLAELQDAPGVLVISLILIFAAAVIGVITAILERLLKSAINFKNENDLTI